MRSEFEKNVIHKQIIDRVRFREKTNQYLPIDALSGVARGCADVVNVGWISYQYQQSKVDGLQKRLDAAIYLLPSIKAENDLWGCDQVERQIELLEQALKGGSDEAK